MSYFVCKDCDRFANSDDGCVACEKCDALLCETCEPEPEAGKPLLCKVCYVAENRVSFHREVIEPIARAQSAQMRSRP